MKSQLHIDEIISGQARPDTDRDAQTHSKPRPLSFWRDLLAKTNGQILGAEGEQVPVSLERWADADDDTLLDIYVTYVDPKRVGTIDPHGGPR